MKRLLQCCLLILFIFSPFINSARAAKFKPIVLHPDYQHDKFVTLPKDILRQFRAYLASFDSEDDDDGDGEPDLWGIPHFVAYEIKRFPGTLGAGPERPNNWITDKKLAKAGIAPTDATYSYSPAFRKTHPNWYDRGHLCMKEHAWRLGPNADWNTHTVLNAVPQRHEFNAGIWLDLENKTAEWADEYGDVWIIAGPIITNRTPREWLGEPQKGEMKIAIPDALFKIVIKESDNPYRPDVLAFIYPQEGPGFNAGPFEHERYLVSVDEIEAVTGLDFLTVLPDWEEEDIESVATAELWQ